MTREKAIEMCKSIKDYLTAGNPVWSKEEVAEALDIAIESMQAIENGDYIELDEELEAMLMV